MPEGNLSPTTRAHLLAVETIQGQLRPSVKDSTQDESVDWGEVMREIHADRIGIAEYDLRAAISHAQQQGIDVLKFVRDELSGAGQ